MNNLDLRIKYKFDSGLYPVYPCKNRGNVYKGLLTDEYAKWMEEYIDVKLTTDLRLQFLRDTGSYATYLKDEEKRIIGYKKAYKEWLENIICKIK